MPTTAPDLVWTHEPRTAVQRARTDLGDYTIAFSGYDYIAMHHPPAPGTGRYMAQGTQIGRFIAPGHLKTVVVPAHYNELLTIRQAVSKAVDAGLTAALAPAADTDANAVQVITQAIVDEIDWTDGSNAHTQIIAGLTKGLAAAAYRLTPKGDTA